MIDVSLELREGSLLGGDGRRPFRDQRVQGVTAVGLSEGVRTERDADRKKEQEHAQEPARPPASADYVAVGTSSAGVEASVDVWHWLSVPADQVPDAYSGQFCYRIVGAGS